MIIVRLLLLAGGLFFLASSVYLGQIDGLLGIDFTTMSSNALNTFKYTFFVLFSAFMLAFGLVGGEK